MNGPDQVLPAEFYTSSDRNGKVKLRIPKNGNAVEMLEPISLPGLLKKVADDVPDKVAYAFKENGRNEWTNRTYREFLQEVRTIAKGFLHLGLERYHSVCILGRNSPEWLLSNIAAIFAGGIACGIYTTNSSESCYHVAYSSAANIIVVEDSQQLEKIQSIRHRLPNLKAIIQFSGQPEDSSVFSWAHLLKIGNQENDEILDNVLKTIAINECSTLVFTSGTTGQPKGVLLSHDNLIWNVRALSEVSLENQRVPFRFVCYLPFSHIAAQSEYIYLVLHLRGTLYFADKDAIKGTVLNTYREVEPNIVVGVPRIFEKMCEFIKFKFGLHSEDMLEKMTEEERLILINEIQKCLGLSKILKCICGAAPLAKHVKTLLYNLNLHVSESFGMSECGGLHTTDFLNSFNLDAAGKTPTGMQTKLKNPVNGEGELLLYGRHIFMGYLDQPDYTQEVLDENGWLHSGDIGTIDENKYVTVTGRSKELIITAGGENVAPVPIEEYIKSILPIVSNALLIGDKRKYLTILLTLKTEIGADGKPLDTLLPGVQNLLVKLGCPAETVTQVLGNGVHPNFQQCINSAINKYNNTAISNAQRIQKFLILPVDFSIVTGEMGPTLKLKRNVVTKKYKNDIDNMY